MKRGRPRKNDNYTAQDFFENPEKVKDIIKSKLESGNSEGILKAIDEIKSLMLTDKLLEIEGTKDALRSNQIIPPTEAMQEVYSTMLTLMQRFAMSVDSRDVKNCISAAGTVLDIIKVQAGLAKDHLAAKESNALEQMILDALATEAPDFQKKIIHKIKEARDQYLQRGLLGAGGENSGE